MPRIKGFLQIAGRCERTVGYISISTSPAMLRTAMAVCTLPRIITPSKSACPPMFVYLLFAIRYPFTRQSAGILPFLHYTPLAAHVKRGHGT